MSETVECLMTSAVDRTLKFYALTGADAWSVVSTLQLGSPVLCASVHPVHARLLATASMDGSLAVFDLVRRPREGTAALASRKDHAKYVVRCAWSSDGRWLASAGYDRRVLVYGVTVARDEREENALLAGEERDAHAGALRVQLELRREVSTRSNPEAVCFLPDSSELVYACRDDHLLHYLKLPTKTEHHDGEVARGDDADADADGEWQEQSFNLNPNGDHWTSFSVSVSLSFSRVRQKGLTAEPWQPLDRRAPFFAAPEPANVHGDRAAPALSLPERHAARDALHGRRAGRLYDAATCLPPFLFFFFRRHRRGRSGHRQRGRWARASRRRRLGARARAHRRAWRRESTRERERGRSEERRAEAEEGDGAREQRHQGCVCVCAPRDGQDGHRQLWLRQDCQGHGGGIVGQSREINDTKAFARVAVGLL